MLGYSHALTGTIGGVTTALILHPHSGPVTPILWGIVTAGAAILPDLDHPDASLARTYGPITYPLAWITNKTTGHRGATHYGIASIITGAATCLTWLNPTAGLIVIWLLAGAATRAFGDSGLQLLQRILRATQFRDSSRFIGELNKVPFISGLLNAAIWAAIVLYTKNQYPADITILMRYLPLLIFVGYVLHLLGDTPFNGIPWLGPFNKKRFGDLPYKSWRVGSAWEIFLLRPIFFVCLAGVSWLYLL